jgi:hypothetical protein
LPKLQFPLPVQTLVAATMSAGGEDGVSYVGVRVPSSNTGDESTESRRWPRKDTDFQFRARDETADFSPMAEPSPRNMIAKGGAPVPTGSVIKLHGLARDAEFNGLTAVVVGHKANNRVIAEFNTVVDSPKLTAGRRFCVNAQFCVVGQKATRDPGGVEEDGVGGLNTATAAAAPAH